MALVIVNAPYPAGSSASISPPAAVFEIAPAKVLQGAVRLQGFASSPTPETQVREACADIRVVPRTAMANSVNRLTFFILHYLLLDLADFRTVAFRDFCPTTTVQAMIRGRVCCCNGVVPLIGTTYHCCQQNRLPNLGTPDKL